MRIEATKFCEPLASRSQEDVLRAIINMYMRLRADGYIVTQLHSDRGAEFRSKSLGKWCMSRTGISPRSSKGHWRVGLDHSQIQARFCIHSLQAGIFDHQVTYAGCAVGETSMVLPSGHHGPRFDFPECQR